MKLISPSTGWVLASDRLFWTSDDGGNWNDITPPSVENILSVYFLSNEDGWTLSRPNLSLHANNPILISATDDGGANWHTVALDTSPLKDNPILGKGAHLYFLDSQNGWATIRDQTSVNFDSGIMIRTLDGGKTWTLLPTPPSAGDMSFTDGLHGWLIGGPAGDQLWKTSDGGQTWVESEITVEGPPGPCRNVYQTPFSSNGNTFAVTATAECSNGTYLVAFETQDSGHTWQLIANRTLKQSLYRGWIGTFAGKAPLVIRETTENGLSVQSDSNSASVFYPATLPPEGTIVSASFVDNEVGWIIYVSRQCAGGGIACENVRQLFSTSDGGASFHTIFHSQLNLQPRSDNNRQEPSQTAVQLGTNASLQATPNLSGSSSQIYQGEGFDTCVAPSATQMQSQWGQSYNTYGVYIGGDNYSCKAAQGSILSSAWTSSVASQGWGLAPIWVGYQASCVDTTGCENGQCTYISTSLSTAASEGQQAADAAESAAQFYGMNSTIIYYDMESYATGNSSCSASVTAFVNAWVQELHSKGYDAGIYGDPNNAGDWSLPTIGVQPDAAWLAAWNTYNDVANLPNSSTDEPITYNAFQAWPVNMRLHQWCNSSLGGYPYTCPDQSGPSPISSILSISGQQGYDDDAVNGPVYASSTASGPTLSSVNISPTTVTSGGSATVTVTLNGPAPSGGAYITLTSNPNTAFPVIGFNVPAGQTSNSATFGSGTVTSSTTVTVTASYNNSSQQAQVTVNPAVSNPTVSSVSISPTTVTSGGSATV
ncbi:MAG: glycoside hydrolase domain-containing protein, partial [Candidatus Saccharimonadales bacterium]